MIHWMCNDHADKFKKMGYDIRSTEKLALHWCFIMDCPSKVHNEPANQYYKTRT